MAALPADCPACRAASATTRLSLLATLPGADPIGAAFCAGSGWMAQAIRKNRGGRSITDDLCEEHQGVLRTFLETFATPLERSS